MKLSSNLLLSATLACCAAAAQAGTTTIKAAELPRISNGGTGFIGVTDSVGMKGKPFDVRWSASSSTVIPLRAGEASTVVNGRPNENPDLAGLGGNGTVTGMQGQLRTMGGSAAMSDFPAGAHRGWGTPD